jgi:hypothetical protein
MYFGVRTDSAMRSIAMQRTSLAAGFGACRTSTRCQAGARRSVFSLAFSPSELVQRRFRGTLAAASGFGDSLPWRTQQSAQRLLQHNCLHSCRQLCVRARISGFTAAVRSRARWRASIGSPAAWIGGFCADSLASESACCGVPWRSRRTVVEGAPAVSVGLCSAKGLTTRVGGRIISGSPGSFSYLLAEQRCEAEAPWGKWDRAHGAGATGAVRMTRWKSLVRG